jgi:hypothetical protein
MMHICRVKLATVVAGLRCIQAKKHSNIHTYTMVKRHMVNRIENLDPRI